jgi:hypothetical protein
MSIIQASIPLFFLLIGAELLWSWRSGRRVLRMNDSLSDLSCGVLSQLSGIFTKLFSIGIFIWVGARFTVQDLIPAIPAWPERAPFVSAAGFPGFSTDVSALLSWTAVFVLVDKGLSCFFL